LIGESEVYDAGGLIKILGGWWWGIFGYIWDGKRTDSLRDTRQFTHQPLYILSRCAEVDEVEGGMAEMSKV
jgi:hypothetical protein